MNAKDNVRIRPAHMQPCNCRACHPDTVTAFREIEIQPDGLQWERLYFLTWNDHAYREPAFHPIRTVFNLPSVTWVRCQGVPSDAENIGPYAFPAQLVS